jgi:hypothetical protein
MMKIGKNSQQYAKGRAAMPEVMAINKDRSGAVPIQGPVPKPANAMKFAKGGKVHADEAMDRKLISAMIKKAEAKPHKEGKKKMAHGGKMAKYAAGGVAKLRKKSPTPKPPRMGTLVGGIKK